MSVRPHCARLASAITCGATLIAALATSAASGGQPGWASYDASFATLPQAQCWPLTIDSDPPNAVPSVSIQSEALHLDTTMLGAGSTQGAAVYWSRQDIPIDFAAPGGAVAEVRVHVVHSDYGIAVGFGWPRPGYALSLVDRSGRAFWVGFGSNRVFLSNDFYGFFGTPGTVEAAFDTTDGFHTYRLEASTAGATLFVDGAPLLGLTGTGPNFGASPPGYVSFGDPTYWSNSNTYTSFVRINGNTPCCDSIGPTAHAGGDQTVFEGAPVLLDGSASRIACGPATYGWTQLAGTPVALNLADPSRPIFNAPAVSIGTETLSFQLTVVDNGRASAPDTVNVTVANVGAPPELAYDGSAGTPEGQCWPFILDTSPPATPDVAVVDGALHLSTTMLGVTGTDGGAAYWARQDIPIDFGAPGGVVAEVRLRVEQSDYGINPVDGWPRPGYALTVTDRWGRVYWIGFGSSRIFLSNDLYGQFGTAGTVEADFDTTDAPRTYRLEASTAGATLFIDGFPALGVAAGPNFGASSNGSIEFGDPTYWANSETYTTFVRIDGVPCCDTTGPIASAGPDQSVPEGSTVVLDGSSSAIDCGSPTHTWTQLAGTPVMLDLTDPAHPQFTAPMVALGGETLTFQLVVDNGHRASEPDAVNITVTNINHAPLAVVGPDQAVAEGSAVALDGSDSFDEDDDPLVYTWAQTAGTPVALDESDPARPTFTAPLTGAGGDVLAFELTISDTLDYSTDSLIVIVENVNHSPSADAGADQTRAEGSAISLDATGSGDPDGDPLTFAWAQAAGPAVVLSDPGSPTPSFIAPQVGVAGAVLVFSVTVDDGYGGIDSDEVAITVHDTNSPPDCALARPSLGELWPPNHKMIAVSITGVTDPEQGTVAITILGVTQEEPVEGLGDGDTAPDAVIQGSTVLLRAERSGNGNGRVYRVSFRAVDGSGGQCTGQVSVCVPHSRGRNATPCVDDGHSYNSLAP